MSADPRTDALERFLIDALDETVVEDDAMTIGIEELGSTCLGDQCGLLHVRPPPDDHAEQIRRLMERTEVTLHDVGVAPLADVIVEIRGEPHPAHHRATFRTAYPPA